MEGWNRIRGGRILASLLLLTAVFGAMVAGCGGRRLGLTGGSIPIGVASLQGRVVRADDIGSPVGGAQVTLAVGTGNGPTPVSAQTMTDQEGRFAFEQIAGGTYVCTIAPPSGASLQTWSYPIEVPKGTRAQLNVSMLSSNTNVASIAQVQIVPDGYALNVGDTVRFTAQSLDENGQVLHPRGSLMLVGDVGEMGADGTLLATKPGTATLVAWSGNAMATAQVKVVP